MTNAVPMAVYQNERTGQTYTVRLHFAETSPAVKTKGQRLFNVSSNGLTKLTNFDIYAAASGRDKAVVREFAATSRFGHHRGQFWQAFEPKSQDQRD